MRGLDAPSGPKSPVYLKNPYSEPISTRRSNRRRSGEARQSRDAGGSVYNILIVEDSATMRAMLVATLEELEEPVKVTEAASGFEALRILPRESFDLIVTDINMPDINGLELVSFIKRNESYCRIPLVIVSTEGSERDRQKGLELGADAYLSKPFEPLSLREVVCGLLAGSGQRASRAD